uniref:Mitochondrial genome maintenance exonuclease 1 n=1 Tax=Phallusia mammillata TaxID=59560 RepID=A0A6F9DLH1_9ASCI|nr:mitochondrial genome maintenance exonuclease 1 [Phallusia mammillata]
MCCFSSESVILISLLRLFIDFIDDKMLFCKKCGLKITPKVYKQIKNLVQRFSTARPQNQTYIGYPLYRKNPLISKAAYLKHKDTKEIPPVTTVLNETRTAEENLRILLANRRKMTQLGLSQFNDDLSESIQNGKTFHSTISDHLKGFPTSDTEMEDHTKKLWDSVNPILRKITEVRHVERWVAHPDLGYKGTLDCIGEFRGKWHLIEWKTSMRKKESIMRCYNAPMQLAAYTGAYNITTKMTHQIKNGLLVYVYHDGSPADTFELNTPMMKYYWDQWLRRLAQYKISKNEQQKANGRAQSK